MKAKDVLSVLAFCTIQSLCLIPLGPSNPYYPIASYNGSREEEYWVAENILNDDPVDLFWYQNIFSGPDGNLWIADAANSVIGSLVYNYGNLDIIAGAWGVNDSRTGAFRNARFSAPSALSVFTYDTQKAYAEINKIVTIVKNTPECQYVSYDNYTGCDNSANLTNSTETVDPNLVRILYPTDNGTYFNHTILEAGKTYIFVADSNNNCIRLLDMEQQIVSTYAGQCGTAGFLDGPPEVNMINGTVAIGVDALGYVFLYDSNNSYIRMINNQGTMYTLVSGACRNITSSLSNSPWGTPVRCYRDWIETQGTQIWTEPSALDRCFLQEVLCVNSTSASPINYQNQTLRKEVSSNSSNSSN